MTQDPINALRLTIYDTKHTNNTKTHVKQIQQVQKHRNPYFPKKQNQNDQRLMMILWHYLQFI